MQLDLTTFSIDEMDYFAETLGFEIEELSMSESGQMELPDGVPMRKFMRCMAGIAMKRENPDVSEQEIGATPIEGVMALFGGETDVIPPDEPPA